MKTNPKIDQELVDAHESVKEEQRLGLDPSAVAKALRRIPNADLYRKPEKPPARPEGWKPGDPDIDLNKHF